MKIHCRVRALRGMRTGLPTTFTRMILGFKVRLHFGQNVPKFWAGLIWYRLRVQYYLERLEIGAVFFSIID